MSLSIAKLRILRQQRQFWILTGLLILLFLVALLKAGFMGMAAFAGFLSLLIFTPLFVNRYSLFLFFWLFITPSFDNMRDILIANTNPVVLLVTAITLPFALFMVIRDMGNVVKRLPFVGLLLGFNLVLFLNILRPDAEQGVLQEALKLFFEIFIIFCTYHVYQKNKTEQLFQQINIFMIFNSCVAIFQRVTGIGLSIIEGLPRVGGLVGHPNALAFFNVIFIPFGIYQISRAKTKKQRIFWISGVALTTLVLILTLCKNVIVTMVIEYFVLFLFLPNGYKMRCFQILLLLSLLVVGINAGSGSALHHMFSDRFSNNNSLEWRYRVWGYLWNDIDFQNIWLGHGVNVGKTTIEAFNPFGPKNPTYIHNVYLQLLFENGLTGLIFIFSLLYPGFQFLKSFFQSRTKDQKLKAVVPMLILLSIFINMATDNSVFLRTPMSYAWLFIAYYYISIKKNLEIG